jgi:hypothetical protein
MIWQGMSQAKLKSLNYNFSAKLYCDQSHFPLINREKIIPYLKKTVQAATWEIEKRPRSDMIRIH